jgi:hypothetical protein
MKNVKELTVTLNRVYNSTPSFQFLFGRVPEITKIGTKTIVLDSPVTVTMRVNHYHYSKLIDNQTTFDYTVNQ